MPVTALGTFGSLALIVTSMYVAYTAVGSPGVDGVQSRYILPLLAPFLLVLLDFPVSDPFTTSKRTSLFLKVQAVLLTLLVLIVFVVRFF